MQFVNLSLHTILMTTVYKYINHQQRTQDFQQVNSLKEDNIKMIMEQFINQNI